MSRFDELGEWLRRLGSPMSAGEAHGCLCGMLAVNVSTPLESWLKVTLDEPDEADALLRESRGLMQAVYDESRAQLQDPTLGFHLLLPGDPEPLAVRVEAIGEWCEGFLYGLAVAGINAEANLPGDCGEILRDLADIARAGFEVEEDEENEQAYAEIVEYVRMGALLINEELQPTKAPPRLQ